MVEAFPHLWERLGLFLKSRVFRFLVVGGFNTAFGYAVFALIYFVTNDHRVAIVLATLVGVAFNFFTTGRIVFKNNSARAAIPFVMGYCVILGLNLLLVELFVSLGAGALVAQALAMPFVVVASYLFNALVVFRRTSTY